jgi:aspartokinase/homoserine dehydrogenase 1
MAGVPGTTSTIFSAVEEVGANVIMISQVHSAAFAVSLPCFSTVTYMKLTFLTVSVYASSEQSVFFAVPEKEVKAVSEVLQSIFNSTLYAGRLSQVPTPILL